MTKNNNNNNNNGFKILFGVRRHHQGPPFARGYHQFIIIGGKPGRRGKEKVGTLVGSVALNSDAQTEALLRTTPLRESLRSGSKIHNER